jgi:hypothetical protein
VHLLGAEEEVLLGFLGLEEPEAVRVADDLALDEPGLVGDQQVAAAVAVEAGVMQPLEQDAFELSRPVTGAEAVAAVNRLADLAGQR